MVLAKRGPPTKTKTSNKGPSFQKLLDKKSLPLLLHAKKAEFYPAFGTRLGDFFRPNSHATARDAMPFVGKNRMENQRYLFLL